MKHRTLALLALMTLALGCGSSDGAPTSGPASAGSTSAELLLVNQTSQAVYYLYVSPCAQSTWGGDQLGSRVVPSGGTFTVNNIPPGCYDLRAEASGHTNIATRRGTDFQRGFRVTWVLGG